MISEYAYRRSAALFTSAFRPTENEVNPRPEDCPCPICLAWAAEIEATGRRHLAGGRTPDDSDLTRVEPFP